MVNKLWKFATIIKNFAFGLCHIEENAKDRKHWDIMQKRYCSA